MNRNTTIWLLVFGIAAAAPAIISASARASAPPRRFRVVNTIDADLKAVPVVAEIPSIEPGGYRLESADRSLGFDVEIFREGDQTKLAAVIPAVAAKSNVEFELRPSSSRSRGLSIERDDEGLAITIDAKPFTRYIAKSGPKPYFFPVIGPTGARYTRAYPMENIAGEDRDHPHQRSFWFTHGSVNGIDFWAEQKGHGFIDMTSLDHVVNGARFGGFESTDRWLAADHQTPVCDDRRVFRFFVTDDSRIIDSEITLTATYNPVVFGDTKEGAFGLRVASSMDAARKGGGTITNAEGLTNDAAWGKPSPWVDYTGPVEGKTVGIAILNHPSSFRHPTPWHVRPYGLFAANPFGDHDFKLGRSGAFTLDKGRSITLRYRVIFHQGSTEQSHVNSLYQAYAHPPAIRPINLK